MIGQAGAYVLYLPVYSPELNAIEILGQLQSVLRDRPMIHQQEIDDPSLQHLYP